MTATLEENRLNLSYKLNVAKSEKIINSYMWVWTNRTLHKCSVSGKILNEDTEPQNSIWDRIYFGKQLKEPITFLGPSGKLEIQGSTSPPVCSEISSLKKYPKLEAVYGWVFPPSNPEVFEILRKGTYFGNMSLTYER